MAGGFSKQINESEAAQLLSEVSKFAGPAGVVVKIGLGILDLSKPSDTDLILSELQKLQSQMQEGFMHLGDLIRQQTQLIIQEVNRNDMSEALAHSVAALNSLAGFLKTKDHNDLDFANIESILGVEFFLNRGQPPLDPFFLPGLVKAGTIRVSTIVVQDPNFFTSRPLDVNEISRMIDYLEKTIGSIKRKVEEAHYVSQWERRLPDRPGEPGGVINGYYVHVEQVRDAQGKPTGQYKDVPHNYPGPEGTPRAEAARTLAEKDRSAGVANELAYIGIPGFEAVLQDWKTMVRA